MKVHFVLLCVLTPLIAALLHGTAGPAQAKSASWVISGGELGDYAFRYWSWPGWEDEAAIPGGAPTVAEPAEEPALRYDIYPSWGVFAVAMQLQEGRPAMAYYPEERLLRESRPGGSETWYALPREGAGLLDEAIAEALRRKAAGELDPSPVVADFRARGVHKGQLSFRPSHHAYAFNIAGAQAEELVLDHLAAIVSEPPAGESRETPRYSIQIWVGTRFEGWGGALGYYSPPAQGLPGFSEGLPGRFWIESISLSEPNPYYATTPGFDRIVEEALRAAEAATLAPDEQPVPSLAAIAAEAGEAASEPAAIAPVDGPNPRGQGAWNWPAALAAGAGLAAGVAALPAARRFWGLRRGS